MTRITHEVSALHDHLVYELSDDILIWRCGKSKFEFRVDLSQDVKSFKQGHYREDAFYLGWLLVAMGLFSYSNVFDAAAWRHPSASFLGQLSFSVIGWVLVVAAWKRYRVHRLKTRAGDLMMIVHDSKNPESGDRLVSAVQMVITKHQSNL